MTIDINHISNSHLLMSSQIKHYWFFLIFVNGDHHIFPQKNACGLKDWGFNCNCFSNLKVFDIAITMDILLIYNSLYKVSERITLQLHYNAIL